MSCESENYLVYPMLPTHSQGETVLPYPPTDTLALSFVIECIFVLPAFIDIRQFNDALARTLAIFLPVAGRLCKGTDAKGHRGDIYLKLTNGGIPVSVHEDYTTVSFPLRTVLTPTAGHWVDNIPLNEVVDHDQPLLRIRFTKLHKTGELVYGVSWMHALGDGASCFLFLRYINHFYRRVEIRTLPRPSFRKIFFPPPPSDEASATKFLPLMKHIRDAKPAEELMLLNLQSQERTLPVNLTFTPIHMRTLVRCATSGSSHQPSKRYSRIDVLIAYLVYTYNDVCAEVEPEKEAIDTINYTLDYRGNPLLAPPAMFGNAAITLPCPPVGLLPRLPKNAGPRDRQRHFENSLAMIAETVRSGILQARDPEFLSTYLRFHNDLCCICWQQNLFQNLLPSSSREITFNSSCSIDCRKAADFFSAGTEFSDGRRTRFHISAMFENYIRIFPSNPCHIDSAGGIEWDDSLDGGAEAAFRLDKGMADIFRARVEEDMRSDFSRPFTCM